MEFKRKLAKSWEKSGSLLCIGLDPDTDKMPKVIVEGPEPLFTFNKAIIDATADLVCAYKPNTAFYEAAGLQGIEQLKKTCDYLVDTYPEIPIILDFKRGDIGNTNNYYAQFAFDYLRADAITIAPYMGKEANQAFLDRADKGVIVLCRTSNEGSGEFQELQVGGKMLFQIVAESVLGDWNENNNCALVVGATYPHELAALRKTLGNEALFLIPGVGAQGGDVEATVKAGIDSKGAGVVINASRAILYASDDENFAVASKAETVKLNEIINNNR